MTVEIIQGDALAVLARLEADGFHAAVTDPPYMLTAASRGGSQRQNDESKPFGRHRMQSGGFMGSKWDAPEAPPIDADFANWLAGFVDGEGCFHVHKKQVNGFETYDCQFSISLRADDKPVLAEIQRRFGGIGSLADTPARGDGNDKPKARYCISSKADCALLREVLTVFPLRAKKARDFVAWSHALDCWIGHQTGEWEDMAYYRDALMAVKRYGSTFSPEQLWHYRWAREVYRVLKPGAHLLAFGGTRTFHRLACAIEDAGFEIRDTIMWLYGQGFAKNGYLSYKLEGQLCERRDGKNYYVGTDEEMRRAPPFKHPDADGVWGQAGALKPACEPIIVARKPLSEGTVAANVLRHGTGALNVDACRVATPDDRQYYGVNGDEGPPTLGVYGDRERVAYERSPQGRWPANVAHDGSPEVMEAFARFGDAGGTGWGKHSRTGNRQSGYGLDTQEGEFQYNDTGTAARFFFCGKATADERVGSHPTVKPVALMEWLAKLVCPPNGRILDPFCGTGSTLVACDRLGFDALGIEENAKTVADAHEKIRRMRARRMIGDAERVLVAPGQLGLPL